MPAGTLSLKIEEGAKLTRRLRVVGQDRVLVDLTNWSPRSQARPDVNGPDKNWDYREDGEHLSNGLTNGTIDLVMTAQETAAMDNSVEADGSLYDIELVKCAPTLIVDGGANSVAFTNNSGFGCITLTNPITLLLRGAVLRLSACEDAANNGSYMVCNVADDGAPANPTTTVIYVNRTVTANAADTAVQINECVLDEDNVVRLVQGSVDFNEEATH